MMDWKYFKYLFIVLFTISIFLNIILLFGVVNTSKKEVIETHLVISKKKEGSVDNKWCTDENLQISELPDYISSNKYALSILRDNCSFVVTSKQKDIDKNGNKETIMLTTKLDCGTAICTTRTLYVISDKETFYTQEIDSRYFELY